MAAITSFGEAVTEKELENGSVRDRLLATAERFRESGAIDDDCHRQRLGLAPYEQQFARSVADDVRLSADARGRGVSQGSGEAPQLGRPAQLDADRAALSDLEPTQPSEDAHPAGP
jgi:hypothetical protein